MASGIGTQLLGIILQVAGFNGDVTVQTDTALTWIENCTTFVPVIFIIISCYALYKYPINKKVFHEICLKLEERKKH